MPKKERDRIHRSAKRLRAEDYPVRWVTSDLFHLTLKFLGNVHPAQIEDIAEVVAKWTGIPVSKMMEGELEKLVRMEDRIKQRVIGQEEAIIAVKPYAVDVASGVEASPAIKDHNKIHAFVENAKEIELQK
ncbi:MAG: 2'-5' RNA ligase family protein [Candidatus Bathyarchaeota archaeon]